MFAWIRNALSEDARQRGIDTGRLSFFKRVGGDLSSGGKAIFEILGPGSSMPLWVAKAARSPEGNQTLRQEYERLKVLHQRIPPELEYSLPRPIAFDERETGSVSLETALPGEKVSRLLREHGQKDPWRTWKDHCGLALDWYILFSRDEPRHTRTLDEDWWQRRVIRPLEEADDFLRDLSPHWDEVLEAIRGAQSSTSKSLLQDLIPHGDFTPTNLVVQGDSIGAFDWSPVDPELPPGCDLFHFMVSSGLYLGQSIEKKLHLSELRMNVLSDKRFLEPICPYLRQYFNDFSIPVELVEPLFLAAVGCKIVAYVRRPEPIRESICGWIFQVHCWLDEKLDQAVHRACKAHSDLIP